MGPKDRGPAQSSSGASDAPGLAGGRERAQAKAPEAAQPSVARPVQEGPRATFAAMKPPALNLPQGGGAMRSIGETFKTNPVTGTASASIPLPMTAAPRGPTPELSLSYDSGSGNGLFGHGWSLGVPQIARRTDQKLPEYTDSEDSDEFLFGGESLVPLYENDGAIRHGTVSGDYLIERYRPRAEGAFTIVERWTHTTNRTVHWRAHAADNTVSLFGLSDDSRIAAPGLPKRVYAWLIDESRDDRGHVVVYGYASENRVDVPLGKAHEASRRTGLAPISNKHLKRVRWGNTTMDAELARVLPVATTVRDSCKLELVFDYGEHHPDAPTPADDATSSWKARKDPFSSHRSGFDMRTYRLCRRVLMFHHFPEMGSHKLVRSLNPTYNENPKLTQLVSAKVVGYSWNGTNAYTTAALPSVSFEYTPATFQKTIGKISGDETRDMNPLALNKAAQWVDLDGEGIPGVLTDRRGALHYKPNMGQAHLAPGRVLDSAPNLAMSASQLMDVAGSGSMSMVRLDGTASGYHERTRTGWGPFRTFTSNPNVDFDSANVRMIDLNGDGFDDILITEGEHFTWYPSRARDGWGAPQRVSVPRNIEEGPAVVFAGRHSSIFLADMSGDGLSDIVRVTHSQVCYWPNLGRGRFGAQIVMDGSPKIDRPDWFHPSRIRLADLDGSGTADLVYFDAKGMHIWPNQAGNGFGAELLNDSIPVPAALPTLSFVDLHGVGMSTAVWSPVSHGATGELRHTSPFGTQKPYLLKSIKNGMGLEVGYQYAASTKFYLAAKKAGKPWATRLPFPVQVVERVESYDAVSRARLVTTFSYAHGFYDPIEREFRGFGLVEQTDAETFSPGETVELDQHPVLTRKWFHTGAWIEASSLEAAFAAERWAGDSVAPIQCVLPTGLTPEERREAHRALKGTMLRQEVYGLDGAPTLEGVPFSVSESSYAIKKLQSSKPAKGAGRPKLHGVYQVLPRETREHTYDRVAADPRVTQWAALAHDSAYGFVTSSASVAYARRTTPLNAAETTDVALAGLGTDPLAVEQGRVYAVVSDVTIAHAAEVATGYRLAIPTATASYELTGLSGSSPLSVETLVASYATASAATLLEYHQSPTVPTPPEPPPLERRLIEKVKVRYFNSAGLPNPLSFGAVDARALVYESYRLDLTDALLAQASGARVTSDILAEGGYVGLPGESGHWTPSGRATLDGTRFFITTEVRDPFGSVTQLTYDDHELFVVEAEDALGNIIAATYDYRVLGPDQITDPNGNRQQASFDELGRVVALAVMGKTTESLGDTLSDPTQEFLYVTDRWAGTSPMPNYVRQRARKVHGGAASWQESYVYSSGSGGVAMTKVQAEPGAAPELDSNGEVVRDINGKPMMEEADPRWVGTGRTVVNNKGNPVKQYEPYFSATHEFEEDDDLVEWGVTPTIHYDALGRATRIDFPDGTYTKTLFGVWKQEAWDQNDTLDDATNAWRVFRLTLATDHPDRIAYDQAVLHAATPSRTYVDALGRPFLAIAHNKQGSTDELIATRTVLDIEGMPKRVIDPLDRTCQTYAWSIAGQLLAESNIDKGDRWSIATVLGEMLRRWDQRGQMFAADYDVLRRPTHLFLTVASTQTTLERRYYGDDAGVSAPQVDNLKGRPIAIYDGAGLQKLGPYDFKGNLRGGARKLTLLANASATPDWSALDGVTSAATAEGTTVVALLEPTEYVETRLYDALNRITQLVTHDTSEFTPTYNDAGLLEAVDVRIRGASVATSFVKNIDYDAKGQRTLIEYSKDGGDNAAFATAYTYDALTFRLKRLVTTRVSPSTTLQDLSYTFDAVGNIVRIKDEADQGPLFTNAVVLPENVYVYDAIYRLISATGREHKSLGDVQVDESDRPLQNLPHANDSTAVRAYEESYEYDVVGNILEMFHASGANTWTRSYDYGDGSTNRLAATSVPAPVNSVSYAHDLHGNMTAMPHMAAITYTPFDQMQTAEIATVDAYYVYDSSGQRVRKVVDTNSNLIKERIYLGGYEIYREWVSAAIDLERQTLHVMDGVQRVAMVETKTIEDGGGAGTPTPRLRFQLGNHLGSATLEVTETGAVISFEEYTPYGVTAYRSSNGDSEVSARRYRYTGKERDDETGLYYNGARYLAAWLGRWTGADPIGIGADGPGLYNYTRGSPVNYTDPSGTQQKPLDDGNMCRPTDSPEVADARITAYEATVKREAEVAAREEAAGPKTLGDRLIHLDFRGAVSSHIDNSVLRGIVQGAEGMVEGQADLTREALATQVGLLGEVGRYWKAADVATSADPEARAKDLDNFWRVIPNPIAAVEGLVHEGVRATRSDAAGGEAKGRLIFNVGMTVLGAVLGRFAGGRGGGGIEAKALPEHLPQKPSVGNPQHGTFYIDPKGNVIPTPPGGSITGSPDARFVQARDASGNMTGVRIDGGHLPKTHPDPRAQKPHGHVPGVSNEDGTPWLPLKQ